METVDNKKLTEEYNAFIRTQSKVPGQDFEPVLFKDVFSQDELNYLKTQFDNATPDQIKVQGYAGLGTLGVNFLNKDDVIKRVERLASDAVGEELEVLEVGGTRYSPEFGWYTKLGPHYDARPVEMYVFDYHVQSTENWGLFMENKRFDFGDNEALLFSGTGRVHWREPIKLKENTKIDLLFFWLQHKNPKPVSKEHREIMQSRSTFIMQKIQPPTTLTMNDWWKPIKISDSINSYPDFIKISRDKESPLKHNTFYTTFTKDEEISNFYLDYDINNPDGQFIEISNSLKNKIINFMVHIHAEYKIKFKNTYFIRYSKNNQKNIAEIINEKESEIVSFMIILTENNFKCLINDKEFTLNKHCAITMSPTHQNFKIVELNEESKEVDLLFFNFLLEKESDDIG